MTKIGTTGRLTPYAINVDAWAARIVLQGGEPPTQEMLRDKADLVSQGDLDTVQLDILCDMIDRRIAKWLKPAKPRRVRADRNADRIDGYDRDDLGESPDY